MKLRCYFVIVLCPLLFWSCATSKAAKQSIDPIAVLSYSSEKATPVAFAVIPPKFILSELKEIKERDDVDTDVPAVEFLVNFFSRADSAFASIMHKGNSKTPFFRLIAFGKFPARAFRFVLNSSRDWERRKEGDAIWFESSSYVEGITLRAAIPVSGVLLAEIYIEQPSATRRSSARSSSMEDFIAASLRKDEAPPVREFSGAGEMFFAAIDASIAGASNVPFVFYAPDFNLFTRTVLPALNSLPFLNETAVAALQSFSLPISSIELAITPMNRAPILRLTVSAAISNSAFLRPASFMLQLMFPGEKVFTKNGIINVEKEMPAGSAALAILSLFSVS